MANICALCITIIMACLALLVVGFTLMAIINMVIEVLDNIRIRFR